MKTGVNKVSNLSKVGNLYLFTKSFAFIIISLSRGINKKIKYLGATSWTENSNLFRHAKRTAITVLDRAGSII